MKKISNKWDLISKLFPFIGLAVIIIVFTILSPNRLWRINNIRGILNMMIPMAIGAMGMVFVAAQGSTDLTQGSLLALCASFAGIVSAQAGAWIFVPLALLVGLAIGIFNGVILAYFKVPSLMLTLAMLIALRAIVVYITNSQAVFLDPAIIVLDDIKIKYPVFILLLIVMCYLFDYTKVGFFSRCIGENQTVGQFAGIPVKKYKILAFALSGLMSAVVGIFVVGSIGGVAATMGNFFELQVMTAMFVGGIPVHGGAATKFYKIIVGSLMLAFLRNGLAITRVPTEISELIQGIMLLLVVFLGLYVKEKFTGRQIAATVAGSDEVSAEKVK
ncbi:MAG: ABC transporter permease [Spirochaetaceae bacterium]|jgi:ribose transport system permease protein|nr:ABC transporter permease [Spirochaetaceae bacterium]